MTPRTPEMLILRVGMARITLASRMAVSRKDKGGSGIDFSLCRRLSCLGHCHNQAGLRSQTEVYATAPLRLCVSSPRLIALIYPLSNRGADLRLLLRWPPQ